MSIPLGFASKGGTRVCRFNKSLYGLRQATRQWFANFSIALLDFGFTQSKANYSLFTRSIGSSFIMILVYVDDIIVLENDISFITALKTFLPGKFTLKTSIFSSSFLALR